MLTYRIPDNAYELLGKGKILKAGKEADTIQEEGIVGDIIAAMDMSKNIVKVYTHIQTRWDGVVEQSRRRAARHPVYIGGSPVLLIRGAFLERGILYSFNAHETPCGGGDYFHKSDVVCSALQGNFKVTSQEELAAQIALYAQVANRIYSHLHDPRNSEEEVGGGPGLSESQLEMIKNPQIEVSTPDKVVDFDESLGDKHSYSMDSLLTIRLPGVFTKKELDRLSVRMGHGGGNDDEKDQGSVLKEVQWGQIGGFEKQKTQVKTFIDDFLNPDSAEYCGVDPSEQGGMIFLGPTGWGKSTFCDVAATYAKANSKREVVYLYRTYGSLGSHWRSDEARRIQQDFKEIRELIEDEKLPVYRFEEIQSVGERSKINSNELLEELLAQLGTLDYTNCLIMAATARDPSKIDPQLLRDGRLGEHVYLGPMIGSTEDSGTQGNIIKPEDAEGILRVRIEKAEAIALKGGNENFLAPEGIVYSELGPNLKDFAPHAICGCLKKVQRLKRAYYRTSNEWIPLSIGDIQNQIKTLRSERVIVSTNVDEL
jgi:hypothetical protein